MVTRAVLDEGLDVHGLNHYRLRDHEQKAIWGARILQARSCAAIGQLNGSPARSPTSLRWPMIAR